MRKTIKSFIALLLSANALTSLANNAITCKDCPSSEAAKEFAKTMANELVCSSAFGQGLSCSSQSKFVTILDLPSGNSYKFNVYHDPNPPFLVNAEEWQQYTDSQVAFSELAKFARALENAIITGPQRDNHTLSNSYQPAQASNATEECPSDTALATLVDPNAIETLRDKNMLNIATGVMQEYDVDNTNGLRPTSTIKSIALVFKGQQFSATPAQGRIFAAYIEGFENTERPTNIPDYIAFDIAIVGWDIGDRPVGRLDISDSSRVGGFSLSALKGENGPLLIDNECISSQLDNAAAKGIFEKKVTPISTVGNPASIGNESGGSSGGVIQQQCEIIDFYQGVVRKYTYRKCK